MSQRLERAQVIAYRLAAHGLDNRVRPDELVSAVGRCGIQNTPPGSALLSAHARVEGIEADSLDTAVVDRLLLLTWSMRGAPYYVPTAEASVFTTGVLPTTEEAARHFVLGVEHSVDQLGMTLEAVTDLVAEATEAMLRSRELAIDALGAEVANEVASSLRPDQREVWDSEGPHAKGQPIGEAVVHFCVRLLALRGLVCFAPRSGSKAPFVLTDDWLDHPLDAAEPAAARADLLRRYLRTYGPSTRGDFASWLGVRTGDTDPWWELLEDELVEVNYGGARWMLASELENLRSAVMPTGTRLLPPRDPYMQVRDRGTIVEKQYQRDVWRTVGDPGTVLVDGEVIGTWRPHKTGRKLHVVVSTFADLIPSLRDAIAVEAGAIAPLRGAGTVSTEFATY